MLKTLKINKKCDIIEKLNENFIGVSPSGKAVVSESTMRWFESNYPSHMH